MTGCHQGWQTPLLGQSPGKGWLKGASCPITQSAGSEQNPRSHMRKCLGCYDSKPGYAFWESKAFESLFTRELAKPTSRDIIVKMVYWIDKWHILRENTSSKGGWTMSIKLSKKPRCHHYAIYPCNESAHVPPQINKNKMFIEKLNEKEKDVLLRAAHSASWHSRFSWIC